MGTRVWAQDEEVGELKFVLQRATSSALSVAWHVAILDDGLVESDLKPASSTGWYSVAVAGIPRVTLFCLKVLLPVFFLGITFSPPSIGNWIF